MRGKPQHALSLAVAVAVVLAAASAHAEEKLKCEERSGDGSTYATCFDPGNRLVAAASTSGFGGGLYLRHPVKTDDPSIVWRFDHELVTGLINAERFELTVYSGRFIRHSDDGHIVLPLGTPKKIFLPFDIGAEAEVFRISGLTGQDQAEAGIVRVAILLELSRSSSFHRRLSVGPVVRWDATVDRAKKSFDEHRVTPFSAGAADLYLEDRRGLTLFNLRVEGGREWSNNTGWQSRLRAYGLLERVLIAVNDWPVSLYVRGAYDSEGNDFRGEVGARVGLFQ